MSLNQALFPFLSASESNDGLYSFNKDDDIFFLNTGDKEFIFQASANFQQSGLYRDENRRIAFGNFKLDQGFKLSATKIASPMVSDIFDCVHICLNGANCKSLNFAVNPYANGLYQCELLDTDKYRANTIDLQPDVAFHHYSPWVSCSKVVNTFGFT